MAKPLVLAAIVSVLALAVGTEPGARAAGAPAGAAAEIAWEKTMADAKARAAKEKKPIVVDFWANWCGWCKVQDREIFVKQKMIDFSKGQVYVKLNTEDQGEGQKLAISLGVYSLPTIVVMTPTAVEMDRIPGYIPIDPFIERLKSIIDGKGEFQTLSKKTDPSVEERMRLAQIYMERGNVKDARQALERVIAKDPSNGAGFSDDALFLLARIAYFEGKVEDAKKHLQAFLQKYPNERNAEVAKQLLKSIDQRGSSSNALPPGTPASTEQANPPVKQAKLAWYDDLPDLDLTKLSPERKAELLKRVNKDPCTCGRQDDTIAQCVHIDPQCAVARRLAKELYDAALANRVATVTPAR